LPIHCRRFRQHRRTLAKRTRPRADVEEAVDADEGDLAAGTAVEGNVSLLAEIEHVVAPYINGNDPPLTSEGVGKRETPSHQPVSARSLGKQTRL
jgi:hypothetical protein